MTKKSIIIKEIPNNALENFYKMCIFCL